MTPILSNSVHIKLTTEQLQTTPTKIALNRAHGPRTPIKHKLLGINNIFQQWIMMIRITNPPHAKINNIRRPMLRSCGSTAMQLTANQSKTISQSGTIQASVKDISV